MVRENFYKSLNIDDYTLIESIGSGGTSQVWKVSDRFDNFYALKIFSPERVMNDIDVKIFHQEYQKMKHLNHDGILRINKYGEYDSRPYLVFDLCETSLMKRLRQKQYALRAANISGIPLFSELEIAKIMHQIASALKYLNSKGLIHNDIKPDNILVKVLPDATEQYVLSDFGVSASIKETILRDSNVLIGNSTGLTPDYAAPEQFDGKSDKATDVFSLSITLFELCTGHPPIFNSNITTGMALAGGGSIPGLPEYYSARFNNILMRCMEKLPQDRPTSDQLIKCSEFYLSEGYWPQIDDFEPVSGSFGSTTSSLPNFEWKKYLKTTAYASILLAIVWLGYKHIPTLLDNSEKKFLTHIRKFDYPNATLSYDKLAPDNKSKYLPILEIISTQSIEYTFNHAGKMYAILKNQSDGKLGIITQKAQWAVPQIYKTLHTNYPEIILAEDENGCLYLDIEGKVLCRPIDGFCPVFKSIAEFNENKNSIPCQ